MRTENVTVALVALLIMLAASSDLQAADVPPDPENIIVVAGDDCGWCNYPTLSCPDEEHKVPQGNPTELKDPHSTCALTVIGEGCDNHQTCFGGGGTEAIARLWGAVDNGDTEYIVDTAASYQERVSFNSARNSIQILDCSGRALVMNIPMGNLRAVRVSDLVQKQIESTDR